MRKEYWIVLSIFLVVILALITMATQPANVLGVPNTVTTTDINDSTSGVAQIIAAGSGSQLIYVTHYHIMAAGTVNMSWVYGTGSNCVTNQNTIDGPIPLIAQTGISARAGLGAILSIPAGNALCLNTDQSVQVGGAISWAYGN